MLKIMYLKPFKNFAYSVVVFRTGQALRREENKDKVL